MNVLIVDDHPIIVEGYRNILHGISNRKFHIELAYDCREAYEKIFIKNHYFDLMILDIRLPVCIEYNIFSGEDLGMGVKSKLPDIKLMILSSNQDKFRLYNLIKNTNPDAFLLKQDINTSEFIFAFNKLYTGATYFSKTINELLRSNFTSNITLDKWDRMILYYISVGYRTKDLPSKIPLSLPSIEKRKKLIKDLFEIYGGGDLTLIHKAKEYGFL